MSATVSSFYLQENWKLKYESVIATPSTFSQQMLINKYLLLTLLCWPYVKTWLLFGVSVS